MRRIYWFTRSKLFRQFLKRYLLAFVMPVTALILLLFLFSNSLVKNNIFSAQQAVTTQQQLSLDNEARQYRALGTELSNDTTLSQLLRLSAPQMTSGDIYRLVTLRKRLNSMLNSFTGVDTIMVYFWKNGYCIQPQRALQLMDLYEAIEDQSYTPATFEHMLSLLGTSSRGDWVCMPNASGIPRLYFHMTLPSVTSLQQATLLIAVNPEYIASLLRPSGDTLSVCLLSGDDGRVVYSIGDQDFIIPDNWPREKNWQIETNHTLLSCSRLDNTNDYLLCVYDLQSVLAPLYNVQRISAFCLLLSLVFSAALTFFVSIRNFNPIQQLVNLLPDDGGVQTDEYTRLRMALVEGMEEKERLLWHVTLDSQRKQDEALYKKLRAHSNNIGLLLPENFTGYVCVARIVLIDYTGDAANAQVVVRQTLLDGTGEMFSPRALCIGLDLLMIFRMQTVAADEYATLCRALRGTLQYLRTNKAIECAAVLTQPHPAHDISMEAMSKEIDETFTFRKNEESLTICQFESLSSGMASAMLLTAQRLFSVSRDGSADSAQLLLDTLRHQSDQLIEKSNSAFVESANDDETCLKQIVDIVSRQCIDPMLSVGSIADQLGKKPDAISRLFKKNMKLGLLDYIHHTRVSIAQNLLDENEGKTIAEIAECVGYLSADSFIRSFKRIIGMTPGAYRNRSKSVDI